MVIGEHVNKYLSLNKLGIIKSRSETVAVWDCGRFGLWPLWMHAFVRPSQVEVLEVLLKWLNVGLC